MSHRRSVLIFLTSLGLACARPNGKATLSHDAYVWQRNWSGSLSPAVATASSELSGLRILALGVGGQDAREEHVFVDRVAMAQSRRPVVVVMRIHEVPQLEALSLAPLVHTAREWQRAGVRVRGIEIDHDCPTGKLGHYADWISRQKQLAGDLSLSITALPTWKNSPHLPRLLALVDQSVLQVHAIVAPQLFDARSARSHLRDFSRISPRPFRVALPTYQARLVSGEWLAADSTVLADFLRELTSDPIPGLEGVSWFRLGHADDARAFSPATLAALIRGERPTRALSIHLRPVLPGSHDIVVENPGAFDAPAPSTLRLEGKVEQLEGVNGYVPTGRELRAQAPLTVRAGETVVVGFALGKELALAP